MSPSLSDAFLAARDEPLDLDKDQLEATLAALVAAARAALPGVSVDAGQLVGTLARHPDADDPSKLQADAARDAALSLACVRGDQAALRAFDAVVREVIPGALSTMKLTPARVDEVAQRVRERLLVAREGEEPRLLRYAARGALRGLITVVATRIAIEITRDDQRDQRRQAPDQDVQDAAESPELLLVKAEYRAAFRDAFRGAVSALDAHDKNLLRLHLVGGLTLAELATMYGQHRATIVRQLARIREGLLRTTRASLVATLRIDARELESLWNLVQSRLDVSVMSLLERP